MDDAHGRVLPHHLVPATAADPVLASRTNHPCLVAVGEHDRFLPPGRLAPAVRHTMNLDVHILPGMGHLTTPSHLDTIAALVARIADDLTPERAGPAA